MSVGFNLRIQFIEIDELWRSIYLFYKTVLNDFPFLIFLFLSSSSKLVCFDDIQR